MLPFQFDRVFKVSFFVKTLCYKFIYFLDISPLDGYIELRHFQNENKAIKINILLPNLYISYPLVGGNRYCRGQ